MRHSYCIWLQLSHNCRSFTLILFYSLLSILSFHLSVSLHLFPPLLGSRWCIWCCSRAILQTASQGHSQSKCMLMLCLKELPGVPSTLSPTRCGTRISQGGGSRCEGKGGPAAKICQAVESHLTTQMDTVRPTAADLMEVWKFNGALLAWNAEAIRPTASFSFQPWEGDDNHNKQPFTSNNLHNNGT